MSAKLLRSGAAPMIPADHVAIASSGLQARPHSNRWPEIFFRQRRDPEWIAAAQWTRLRLPCRREEWWG
jgi:hypothetical protein